MSESAVARMTVTIDYEDGARRTYAWTADTRPVEIRVEKEMGERKAEAGAFTIEVSRWPGSATYEPIAARETR